MMDGRVAAIREALDEAGFETLPIVSYAAKYASGFYGPFRDAARVGTGVRRPARLPDGPAQRREALREVALDIEEGADIVMVKPALRLSRHHPPGEGRPFGVPIAAYQVSGEYSMIKAAAERGWIDERRVALESLTAIKRAGADIILTYYAAQAASWLAEDAK